jgi:hypothetical protein
VSNKPRYRNLIKIWGSTCILCGEKIRRHALTREHLICKSVFGQYNVDKDKNEVVNNYALSHYNCNELRGNKSLIEGMKVIEAKKKELGNRFIKWANTPIRVKVKGMWKQKHKYENEYSSYFRSCT